MANSQKLLIEIGQGLSLVIGQPRIVSWATNERPKDPKTGAFGFNIETKKLEVWNGKNWLSASVSKA